MTPAIGTTSVAGIRTANPATLAAISMSRRPVRSASTPPSGIITAATTMKSPVSPPALTRSSPRATRTVGPKLNSIASAAL